MQEEIMERCDHFIPLIVAFKKCKRCGSIYEVVSNFRALDYDLCPECNAEDAMVLRDRSIDVRGPSVQ